MLKEILKPIKIGTPQGTRDFDAEVIAKRNYIFNIIKETFELYGFQPLETPVMENLSILNGKYGDEGEKLIFKILNNGLTRKENLEKSKKGFAEFLEGKEDLIVEKGLRYDLTIPLARYVASNYNQLVMPFKRYQIQSVYRADKPQKGRYREFTQCDADIIGTNSLLCEIELINIYYDVFKKIGLDVDIRINSRKLLTCLSECFTNKFTQNDWKTSENQLCQIIDKLDKVGIDGVKNELIFLDYSSSEISFILNFISLASSTKLNIELLDEIESTLKSYKNIPKSLTEAINELRPILELFGDKVKFDPSLARGLNYYTGLIFEIKSNSVEIGSLGGGGRYDNLTSQFGTKTSTIFCPGIGISFGVERIYEVMSQLSLFNMVKVPTSKILFFNMGDVEIKTSLILASKLRSEGISCEIYTDKLTFDKQFKYADKKKIPFIAIVGSNELKNGTCIIKDMNSRDQKIVEQAKLPTTFKSILINKGYTF